MAGDVDIKSLFMMGVIYIYILMIVIKFESITEASTTSNSLSFSLSLPPSIHLLQVDVSSLLQHVEPSAFVLAIAIATGVSKLLSYSKFQYVTASTISGIPNNFKVVQVSLSLSVSLSTSHLSLSFSLCLPLISLSHTLSLSPSLTHDI